MLGSLLFAFLFLLFNANAHGKDLIGMPWEIHYLKLNIENKTCKMAYIDVRSPTPNGPAVLLLHGKNFNGWYWRQVTNWLLNAGYRVVIPDQLGFGNSDYPIIHYSFHLLAANTKELLDTLKIDRAIVVGHSMGGMLSTRFTLMYPDAVSKLILENPIGLEDYRTIVPYSTTDSQYHKELKGTFESYKAYQMSYFPEWKPAYDSLVIVQAKALASSNFKQIAFANALTYEMIYEQPVCYEFARIAVPTLLVIGQADRTIVGKALMAKNRQSLYGQYPELGRRTAHQIKNAKLVELPGVGHIPHIQDFNGFTKAVANFLN